jgi:hypothetical protein
MKLRDAETLLQAIKSEGPITEHWSVLTDEGITLEAWPLGFARGSWGLRDLITVRPGIQYSALYDGAGGQPRRIVKTGPHGLWQQELYVYMREMREAFAAAFKDLDKAPFFPRYGEHERSRAMINDPLPYPEDFHLYAEPLAVRWRCVGKQDISDDELDLLKDEFCALLAQFTGEKHGQRKVVRVRSVASSETDQGTERPWGDAEIGDLD